MDYFGSSGVCGTFHMVFFARGAREGDGRFEYK